MEKPNLRWYPKTRQLAKRESSSQPQSLSDKTVRRQTHSTFFKLIGIPFVWVSASGMASVFGEEDEGPEYTVAGGRAAGLV